MIARLTCWFAATVLAATLFVAPAHAAKPKREGAAPEATPSKPVVQYMVAVVLILAPIALVCRSSRR